MPWKSLQENLKAREQQLHSIVDHLPLMVVARDAQSDTILSANPASKTILQLDKPLSPGRSYANELSAPLASILARSPWAETQLSASGVREHTVSMKIVCCAFRTYTLRTTTTPNKA